MNRVKPTEGRLGGAKTPRRKLLIQAMIGTESIEGEHNKKARLSSDFEINGGAESRS